jgi:predicted acetyltransferase
VQVDVGPISEGQLEQAMGIAVEAFRVPESARLWLRHGRGLAEQGELLAVAVVEPSGQYFGGQVVQAAVISGLAVRIEHRGRGLGAYFVRQLVSGLAQSGVAVAVHYPRVFSTFQRMGFEFAGTHVRYRVPVASACLGSDRRVERWTDADLCAVGACYERIARTTNGLLARSSDWWHERVLAGAAERPVYRFLVRHQGDVTAYAVYTQDPLAGDDPYRYTIAARDLVWTDPASAQAILGFLRHNAPLGHDLTWSGPVDEPLAAFFDEELGQQRAHRWMLRLLDVRAALESRGYPRGLRMALELTVSDAILPANARAIRLELEAGRGRVVPVPRARLRVDVGTLAALYTGWLDPHAAVRIGRLAGASDADVERLRLIFGGPKPWLMERV